MKNKSKESFNPSPAIFVDDNVTIGESVELMRIHDVGSLLVQSGPNKTLVGIFTERDLLHRFKLIDGGNFWEKPISHAMTRKLITLDIDQIDTAPALLFRNKIRHLPIITKDHNGNEHVVGMLSMRDLFKSFYLQSLDKELVESVPEIKKESNKEKILYAHTADTLLLKFLEKGVAIPLKQTLQAISLQDFGTIQGECLILDLDSVPQSQWSRWLKVLNNRKSAPIGVLLYNPSIYPDTTKQILEKVGLSERFLTFQKPVSLAGLIYQVSQAHKAKKTMILEA